MPEVEEQIAELQDYYHSFEDISDPDHEAQMGDYVQVELTVTNHGRLMSGMNQTQRLVGLGTGSMPPSFDEHLVGAKLMIRWSSISRRATRRATRRWAMAICMPTWW